MKQFIAVIMSKELGEDHHSVLVPELGTATQGKDYNDCIEMTQALMFDLYEVEVTVEFYQDDQHLAITAKNIEDHCKLCEIALVNRTDQLQSVRDLMENDKSSDAYDYVCDALIEL